MQRHAGRTRGLQLDFQAATGRLHRAAVQVEVDRLERRHHHWLSGNDQTLESPPPHQGLAASRRDHQREGRQQA
ncbi:hypothetical protein D3C72_1808640 [compost metagenome]